jgi:DNA-directed RNA polymerase subunit RPC12/RpoP
VAIQFRCECGKEFQTDDDDAGRRARCPVCKRELVVPQPKPLFVDDFAAPSPLGPPQLSGKALGSLILGIVPCILTGVPAIFLGIFGLSDIDDPKKHLKGRGMAITGIVLGGLWSTFVVPAVLIALLLPAVQAAREAARRAQCVNNLKQIALAMHLYENKNGHCPAAAVYDKTGKPLLSWRVLILPQMNQESLFNQFHLDEPWDSPHNRPLVAQIPSVFQCPSEAGLPPGSTTYEVIVDPQSMFTGLPAGVPFVSAQDGVSKTLLVVEAADPVPWTKPEDLSLSSREPEFGMGSKHPLGFNASMADGSVRFLKDSPENPLDRNLLKGLATRNGGESVTPP